MGSSNKNEPSHQAHLKSLEPKMRTTTLLILPLLVASIYAESYEQVKSGTYCNLITSFEECTGAAFQLGLSHTPKGTVPKDIDTYGPAGCYLRWDGDLWYNANEQSTTPCTSESPCICRTGDCSNVEIQELNQLLRDFAKNVKEAID